MQWLEACGVPVEMQCEINAFYESMSRKLRLPNSLLEVVASTIGVIEGCPLSPNLINLYIDDMSHYVDSRVQEHA